MTMPVLVTLPSEVNLRVAEFDSDLNIVGLAKYLLPFAEKILDNVKGLVYEVKLIALKFFLFPMSLVLLFKSYSYF